ncbi:NAD-dependent epimerase/dehydratase family protein [Pedobacter nutrimenti]|uniref:NAD-dependent epimerase/dehydratase family protein n=1 Tax=Pedobacter nutrimenti TaxID=1241337 RepID=UPI0029315976|nr:NAD-dependent epimerase/dehydratase family protein [Pedobacter nutrimenti]
MILITGASGFIGKHLLSSLIEFYGSANIVALTSEPIVECRFLLHHNYTFTKDYFVTSGFSSIRTIIHAGAFTPKNGIQANDSQNCNSNIINTITLLNADLPSLERVIYLSTLDVYGETGIISEDSLIKPISLYGDSKLYCERMLTAWATEQNKICQLLRVGHVYGPGEEAYQKIIPVTIQKILNKEVLEIWGSGDDIRSFINVKDIVKAIFQAMILERSIGPVNLVSSHQITIKSLVSKLIDISLQPSTIKFIPSDKERRDLVFDNTKMRKFLLTEEVSLYEGLLEEFHYMKYKSK